MAQVGAVACPSVDEFAGELPCVSCRRLSVLTVSEILGHLMASVGLELSPLWPRQPARDFVMGLGCQFLLLRHSLHQADH